MSPLKGMNSIVNSHVTHLHPDLDTRLNWLSSSLALVGLGWTSTSCSRKLACCSAHPCSLTGSSCTLIQTLCCVIWGLKGGLPPRCKPFEVDRKNDLVPDHPLGCCLHHQRHAFELQSFLTVSDSDTEGFPRCWGNGGSHGWRTVQSDIHHLQLRLGVGDQALTHWSPPPPL